MPWRFQPNIIISNDSWLSISVLKYIRSSIVGTLVNVGLNKITLDDFNAIIVHKNRDKAGFSVPAHGLYLTEIEYDYL
jgi:tRNA pseudouridine38-40 synthase